MLIIAGPDSFYTRASLGELADELGVSDSVAVVGPVDGGAKSWVYRNCATYVLPSLNENFGITVAEAMLAGCHVVTTTEVAAHEHLHAANSGSVLRDCSVEELADALLRALTNTAKTRHSGDAAHAYASHHLTWDSLGIDLIEHFKTLQFS